MLLRIVPAHITDQQQLATLLRQLLQFLEYGPLKAPLRQISFDTFVSEKVFVYLCQTPQRLEVEINVEDYHCVFERLLAAHPTLKIWQTTMGELFFEI